MPLVSIVKELERATAEHYALPLYDTFDMFSTEGMFIAAEERRAPFMIALYAGHWTVRMRKPMLHTSGHGLKKPLSRSLYGWITVVPLSNV